MAYWNRLRPDVPHILDDYLAYIKALKDSGVSTAAVRRATATRDASTDKRIAALSASGKADDQYRLALIYLRGIGVAADAAKAAGYARKAAEAGMPEAAYAYGVLLMKGEGVARDPVAGRGWIERAAAAGVSRAQDVLAQLQAGAVVRP